MNENQEKLSESLEQIKLDKIIEVDTIKPNSVIIFRITTPSQAILGAIKNFVGLYGDKLEQKDCSLLVLGKDADLQVLNEEEMNKAGWEKKNKSRLIIS